MDKVNGKLTVFFEEPFWVGIFERIEDGKLSVAKVTFGAEPKDYEVIGFLEEDTAVISQGGIIYLDRYMISPSIIMDEPPTTWDELMYQAYAYEEKIEGDAVLTENYSLAEFTADIEQLTNRYSMFDIQIVTPNASFLDTSLILSCYMGKNMFFLLAGIIFLVLTIINWCFSVNLFKMLSNYFGV